MNRRRGSDTGIVESDRGLARMNQEERALSARRTRIQNRLDFLRSGGGGHGAEVEEQIAELERQEREVSLARRELHERIELARRR
jgi:hypothetical protein